ncbi:MAG: hypothetical protein LBT37_06150 [Lactobacillaceae bacterium]|jgi:hypothetical protein|nr:hypothetical protein [Lactobacillaceae bacterium]
MQRSIRLTENIEHRLLKIKEYKKNINNGLVNRNDTNTDAINFAIELTYQLLIQPFEFDSQNNYEEMISIYSSVNLNGRKENKNEKINQTFR